MAIPKIPLGPLLQTLNNFVLEVIVKEMIVSVMETIAIIPEIELFEICKSGP